MGQCKLLLLSMGRPLCPSIFIKNHSQELLHWLWRLVFIIILSWSSSSPLYTTEPYNRAGQEGAWCLLIVTINSFRPSFLKPASQPAPHSSSFIYTKCLRLLLIILAPHPLIITNRDILRPAEHPGLSLHTLIVWLVLFLIVLIVHKAHHPTTTHHRAPSS